MMILTIDPSERVLRTHRIAVARVVATVEHALPGGDVNRDPGASAMAGNRTRHY